MLHGQPEFTSLLEKVISKIRSQMQNDNNLKVSDLMELNLDCFPLVNLSHICGSVAAAAA